MSFFVTLLQKYFLLVLYCSLVSFQRKSNNNNVQGVAIFLCACGKTPMHVMFLGVCGKTLAQCMKTLMCVCAGKHQHNATLARVCFQPYFITFVWLALIPALFLASGWVGVCVCMCVPCPALPFFQPYFQLLGGCMCVCATLFQQNLCVCVCVSCPISSLHKTWNKICCLISNLPKT